MNFGMVLLSNGPFGGAQRRFLTLSFYINKVYEDKIFCFVTHSLMSQIKLVFPNENLDFIIPIGSKKNVAKLIISSEPKNHDLPEIRLIKSTILQHIKRTLIYKYYYQIKNRYFQKKLYIELDKFRDELGIRSLLGIHAGILPLYFYFKNKTRPGIIFSNMDSWFSNISDSPEVDWYKQNILFNFALEKSNIVDFLSPFVLEGVQKMGINISLEKITITPSSFSDYTKCQIGAKEKFRIAFSGRLEKDKNPVLFLEAALILAAQYPHVEFHIMGEGRLTSVIKEKTDISGLPNIVFHGFHPNPPEILAKTSLFVSIQTTNNYPSQSVLEAMACGNAIIASDVGDTRMFVNEDWGSLIELNLESLIHYLKIYIEQPVIAFEKGLKGSEYVRENHTIDKSAEYYLSLLRKAEKLATIN